MSDTSIAAAEVRGHLLENHSGTLGTVSVDARCPGYPFASIVPFALDARGRPLLQIAGIAQHTKNARADPRANLFVHEASRSDDPQAGWRITLLGSLRTVSDEEREEAMARLVERIPNARAYEETHDFEVWRLDVEHVRYIAGFGKIFWIDGAEVLRDPLGGGLAEHAAGAVAHMNADHVSSMKEMCAGVYGFTPEHTEMRGVDRAGILVRTRAPDRLVHFSFGKEIDAGGLRGAVIELVRRARAMSAPIPDTWEEADPKQRDAAWTAFRASTKAG